MKDVTKKDEAVSPEMRKILRDIEKQDAVIAQAREARKKLTEARKQQQRKDERERLQRKRELRQQKALDLFDMLENSNVLVRGEVVNALDFVTEYVTNQLVENETETTADDAELAQSDAV